jgi:hypothetical protein
MKIHYPLRGEATEDLIRELEFRGYWSIPKRHVKTAQASVPIDTMMPYRDDPVYLQHVRDDAAHGLTHFLQREGMLRYRRQASNQFSEELVASAHVVTEMPRSLLPSSLSHVPGEDNQGYT